MRRWILPTLIAIALAIPVIADLYEMVRDRGRNAAPLDVDLLADGVVRFEGRDLVVDLREGRTTGSGQPVEPSGGLGEGWGTPTNAGTWTLANRASLDIRVSGGGYRGLMLQCRPDRRRDPPPILHVSVNGVDCASARLERVLSVVRLELPEGAISSGDNRVQLELRSSLQTTQPASRRTLLVRRVVLSESADDDFERIAEGRAPVVKTASGGVRVREPGTLFLEFDAPRPDAVVAFNCRFRRAVSGASCDVVVGRWFPDKHALDVVGTARVSGDRPRRRDHRVALGNHSGPSVLRIRLDEASAEAELELRSARLEADGV